MAAIAFDSVIQARANLPCRAGQRTLLPSPLMESGRYVPARRFWAAAQLVVAYSLKLMTPFRSRSVSGQPETNRKTRSPSVICAYASPQSERVLLGGNYRSAVVAFGLYISAL